VKGIDVCVSTRVVIRVGVFSEGTGVNLEDVEMFKSMSFFPVPLSTIFQAGVDALKVCDIRTYAFVGTCLM
jgi:hypothetical protein